MIILRRSGRVASLCAASLPLVAGAVALAFSACSSEPIAPPDPATVTTISLAPATVPVLKGSRTVLTLSALDADNQPVHIGATWTSSAPLIASVSSDGVVSGVEYGAATITATIGTRSASAEAVVTSTPTGRTYTVVDLGEGLSIGGMTRQLSDSGEVLAGGKLYRGGNATSLAGCTTPVTVNGPGHVLCKVNAYDSVSSYAIWHVGTLTPLAADDTLNA